MNMKTAVQLYSLRNETQREGIEPLLKAVRIAGFDGVETAGFYGLEPKAFGSLLAKNGLEVSGMHIGLDEVLSTQIVKKAADAGFKNVIVPYIPFSAFACQFDSVAEKMRRAKEICGAAGLSLSYHNHAQEFYCGRDVLAELVKAVPDLKIELDIFWLAVGGKKFSEYYPVHEGKYLTFHIKELSEYGTDGFAPVPGEGFASCKTARDIAKKEKFEWLTLEFEKIDISYDEYLKKSAVFMKG